MTTKYTQVATPVIAEAVAAPLVTVTAPATLDAGFRFEAEFDGAPFLVTVPKGGVIKGQKFEVPFIQSTQFSPSYGKWKDDLCNCCSFGPFHPSFLNAMCCPLLLLGQVMTRMEMNFCGLPGSPEQVQNTFKYLLYIWLGYVVVGVFFGPKDTAEDDDDVQPINPIYSLYGSFLMIYTLVLMYRTRRAIRERYDIPDETTCRVTNDCCCSFWCGCCTISQMARHTADYDTSPAHYCTKTGVRTAAPVMTV